jgi:hypothetical protein
MEVSGELHAPAALLSGTGSGTHWIGGWAGVRASLDAVAYLAGNRTPVDQPKGTVSARVHSP